MTIPIKRALVGQALSSENIQTASQAVVDDLGDIFASADYPRAVAPIYIQRAVGLAAGRA